MNRNVVAWGPAVFWAVFLFLLSEIRDTPPGLQPLLAIPDKLVHFALYFAFGGLLARARWVSGTRVWHAALLVAGALYAAVDELHQSLVPGRNPDPEDWMADVVGVVAGYVLVVIAKRPSPDNLKDVD